MLSMLNFSWKLEAGYKANSILNDSWKWNVFPDEQNQKTIGGEKL